MFVLAVLAGFVIYAALAIACILVVTRLTRGRRYSQWIRAVAITGIVSVFILVPNRNWERPLAYASLSKLCPSQGGEVVHKTVPGVDGARFDSNPGADWLWRMGYKYAEWERNGDIWRVDAGRVGSSPYRIDVPKAKFAVHSQGNGYAELAWNVLMHETKIVNLETGELLAYQRGFRYREAKPSNVELAALPLTMMFPMRDCWSFAGPHVVVRTLRPNDSRR